MNKILKILLFTVAAAAAWYLSAAAAGLTEKVNENTTVNETVVFSKCNHREQTEYTIPSKSANMSPEDAAKSLGASLIEYKNNKLTIMKQDSSCCLKHYRLFLDGSTIKTEVLRTREIKNEYPTAPAQFSEDDLRLLKNGIIADSESELSSIIEDFTG